MKKSSAFFLSILPVAIFAIGARMEDVRMRQHYIDEGIHQGRVSEVRDLEMAGVMQYVKCLSDHCEAELDRYLYVKLWANAEMKKLGEQPIGQNP